MTELIYDWYRMEDVNADYEMAGTPCDTLRLYVYPDEAYEKFWWEIHDAQDDFINGSWEFESEFDTIELAKIDAEAVAQEYLKEWIKLQVKLKEQAERDAKFLAARAEVDQERRAAGMQMEPDKKEQLTLL